MENLVMHFPSVEVVIYSLSLDSVLVIYLSPSVLVVVVLIYSTAMSFSSSFSPLVIIRYLASASPPAAVTPAIAAPLIMPNVSISYVIVVSSRNSSIVDVVMILYSFPLVMNVLSSLVAVVVVFVMVVIYSYSSPLIVVLVIYCSLSSPVKVVIYSIY